MVFVYQKDTNEFFTKDKEYKIHTLINYDEVFVTNDKGEQVKVNISDFRMR